VRVKSLLTTDIIKNIINEIKYFQADYAMDRNVDVIGE